MISKTIPFAPGWWGVDLGAYRPCEGTYCLFAYEALPPLPLTEWHGDFRWLIPLDATLDAQMELYRPSSKAQIEMAASLARLRAQAENLGLILPEPFLRLMGDWKLQQRIPSCTACYFALSERIIPCLHQPDHYLIRFLNDQQGVLLWYLYLDTQGRHSVLVSPAHYDEIMSDSLTKEQRKEIAQATWHCAPHFEAFIYRFWFENVLWFAIMEEDLPLSPEQNGYLHHYATPDKGEQDAAP